MHHASHHSSAGAAPIPLVRLINADGRTEDTSPIPFVVDACENLRVLRGMHGPRGAPYLRQVRRYRGIADTLGCRRILERHLHLLRRRPVTGRTPSWPRRDNGGAAMTAP